MRVIVGVCAVRRIHRVYCLQVRYGRFHECAGGRREETGRAQQRVVRQHVGLVLHGQHDGQRRERDCNRGRRRRLVFLARSVAPRREVSTPPPPPVPETYRGAAKKSPRGRHSHS